MRDMKKCLWDGREAKKGLCDEGYEKMFMGWERGGTYHEPPATETRFLPHTPFAGKPETRFYLKPKNSLIINHLFKLLIINVLL